MTDVSALSTASRQSTSQSGAILSQNFDTFLRLLTAQLQNQNPLDPVDTKEFTQQLVQYSQVEQQIRTNERLESLLASHVAVATTAAVDLIGRDVKVVGSRNELTASKPATWDYVIPNNAEKAVLRVLDSAGREVYREDLSTRAGLRSFDWDGKRTGSDQKAPPGVYRLQVSITDPEGAVKNAEVRTFERVTGIVMDPLKGPSVTTTYGTHRFDQIFAIPG